MYNGIIVIIYGGVTLNSKNMWYVSYKLFLCNYAWVCFARVLFCMTCIGVYVPFYVTSII